MLEQQPRLRRRRARPPRISGGRGLRAAQPRDSLASGGIGACAPGSRRSGRSARGGGSVSRGGCGDGDGGSATFGSFGSDCGSWH